MIQPTNAKHTTHSHARERFCYTKIRQSESVVPIGGDRLRDWLAASEIIPNTKKTFVPVRFGASSSPDSSRLLDIREKQQLRRRPRLTFIRPQKREVVSFRHRVKPSTHRTGSKPLESLLKSIAQARDHHRHQLLNQGRCGAKCRTSRKRAFCRKRVCR